MNEILEDMKKDVEALTILVEDFKKTNDLFNERMIEGLKNISAEK